MTILSPAAPNFPPKVARPAFSPVFAAGGPGRHRVLGLLAAASHGHTLTPGGAVGLHNDGVVTDPTEVSQRCGLPIEGLEAGGRDAGMFHQLFGEDLRAFNTGGRSGGAKHFQIRLPESLGDTPDQGILRSDDGEVNLVLISVVAQRGQVVRRYIHNLRYAGYARVAGG